MIPEVYWSIAPTEQRRAEFGDAHDQALLKERAAAFIRREGPCVGDWVIMAEGDLRRFTHDWGDDIQTTCKGMYGSFHLNREGYASFSGSLDPGMPKTRFEQTDELKAAPFWFFHHDSPRAHSGVNVSVLARVWRLKP